MMMSSLYTSSLCKLFRFSLGHVGPADAKEFWLVLTKLRGSTVVCLPPGFSFIFPNPTRHTDKLKSALRRCTGFARL